MSGAEDAKHLRNLVRQMALDTLPEGEREQGRIEVLPVQWRKHLNLGVRGRAGLLTKLPLTRSALGYGACTDDSTRLMLGCESAAGSVRSHGHGGSAALQ